MTKNYAKGKGDKHHVFIEQKYPSVLLFHVKDTAGSRHDICVEAAGPTCWNRRHHTEFLSKSLRSIKSGKSNELEENVSVILGSVHMIALIRTMAIIYLRIFVPIRWLHGKSRTLSDYSWSTRSMGRSLGVLEVKPEYHESNPSKITDQDFMLGFLSSFIDELPHLKDYLDFFTTKIKIS